MKKDGTSSLLRDLAKPLFLLLMVLCIGTFGFMIIMDSWGFWKSLFFTVITITTVGYSDYQLSPAGEKFALLMMLFGIAAGTYVFKNLIQSIVNQPALWRQRMKRNIDALSNHTVVCGWGHLGRIVCERLIDADKPFAVIEQDDKRFEEASFLGHLCIQGAATDDVTLLQAGIDRAKCLVCAVSSDMENIIIMLSARELNPDLRIICRVVEEGSEPKARRAGADMVVSPAQTGGEEIAELIIHPTLTEILHHTKENFDGIAIHEIDIEDECDLVGRTIEYYEENVDALVFIAIKSKDGDINVRPDKTLQFKSGDVLIVAGDAEAIHRLRYDSIPAQPVEV